MVDTTEIAGQRPLPPSVEPDPTLAPVPGGLSARRVERWLDLPPGAWQRRRLYALRVRGDSFGQLGLRRGDVLIVEPGSRENPGKILVTRGPEDSLSLRPVPLPAARPPASMPSVLELPFHPRASSANQRVVGTVIGLLRSTGTGALRPASLCSGLRKPEPRRLRKRRLPEAPSHSREVLPDRDLQETLRRWRRRLAEARGEGTGVGRPARSGGSAQRLASSLWTLCDCLEHIHEPRLRAALSEQARAIAEAIGIQEVGQERGQGSG
jgi:hypothetical protein